MTEKEISELYTRLAFQYESAIDRYGTCYCNQRKIL